MITVAVNWCARRRALSPGDRAQRFTAKSGEVVRFACRKLTVLAAALCLCAGQARAADMTTKPYPPPGSPDPGAPCQRQDAPSWTGFFCRFMTVDLWKAAGRPDYTAPDGSHWQPWYYGDQADRGNNLLYEGYAYRPGREGILEAMLKTDTLPDEYDPAYVSRFWSLFRYTPWSVYFEHKAGCVDGAITNPYDFAATRRPNDKFQRSALLGMGWDKLARDGADPTQGWGDDAMPVFMSAAYLTDIVDGGRRSRIEKHRGLGREIYDMAQGKGMLHPDYARDGEVWLVNADGTGRRVDDLDAAASYVAKTGMLVTNGADSTWQDGFDLAAIPAMSLRKSVVYIYFAQGLFYPVSDNQVYRRRLQYLVDRAARLISPGAPGFTLVSVGRSAVIAARAALHHARISQVLIAPVPGPGDKAAFRNALRDGRQRVKMSAGSEALAAVVGGAAAPGAKRSACLGGHEAGGDAVTRLLRHLDTSAPGSRKDAAGGAR